MGEHAGEGPDGEHGGHGDEAHAEHHLSPWPLVVGLAIPLALAGVLFRPWGLVPGVALFLIGMGGWVVTDMRGKSKAWYGDTPEARDFGLGDVSIRKLGIWLFLGTEIMFFSAIIGTSWSIRMQQGAWMLPNEVLAVNLTALNTFILIVSSFAIVMALDSIQQGNERRMKGFLLLTLLLGMTFLGIQIFEYVQLTGEGLLPWHAPEVLRSAGDTAAACAGHLGIHHGGSVPAGCTVVDLPAAVGATFYTQTGFHGAHVTAGVIGLAYITKKAFNGRFTKDDHEAIELVGLYWHFVDVVWIFLFTIVYLI